MAAETPITDVLCEAMEYLCKLGTNLRSRSESLKEKRISKSKLKNSHAVQKAANKVLMICQLSKKSLENVETGVRKVLSLVDATQNATMDGGKTTAPKEKNRDNSKYHYFELNSKELRVAKTVALKHFLSVKVCSKKMSLKIQDEYPVFYDCKLLRLRKRKAAIQKIRRSKSSEKTARKLSSNESDNEKLFKKDCENKGAVSLNEGESSHSAQCNDMSQPLSNIRKGETCILNSNTDTKNHNSIVQPTMNITLPTEIKICSTGSGAKVVGIEEPESKSEKNTEISNSVVRKKSEKSVYSRHRKRIKIMDEESNSSSASSKKDNAIECLKEVNKNQNATSDSESNDKEKIHRKKKQKLVDSDQETEKKEFEQIISLDSENEKMDGDSCSENSDQKPMIKCVNINELLKPEALQKDPAVKEKSKKVAQGKPTGPHKRKENNTVELKKTIKTNDTEENGKFDTKQITNDDQTSDREFWEQKRKEVKRFKSKHFEIHLTRLPKFTAHFLHEHKIKRIVQNNSVVFGESHELSKECNVIVDSVPVDNDASHSKSRLEQVKCSEDTDVDQNTVNKVKNALLNESESDDDKIIYSKTDKKNAGNEAKIDDIRRGSTSTLISRNSDIDCEDSENFINALVYETDSDKIETITKENYTNQTEVKSAEELKEALLKDSDSDQIKKNYVHIIQRIEDVEANTSVKSIELTAESENVKNKLLNSDSEVDTKAGSEKNDNNSEANVQRNIDRNNGQSDASQHDNGSTIECKASIESTKSNEGCSHIKDKTTTQSADADVHSTLLSKRSKHKRETIMSKRKHIMESMHAKKMLLSYSSSDTEDEQLKNVLKDIKQALLKGASSDEEKVTYEQPQRCRSRTSSSSSTNDIIKNIKQKTKKKNKVNSSHSESEGSEGDKKQTQDNEDDPKSKSSSSKVRK